MFPARVTKAFIYFIFKISLFLIKNQLVNLRRKVSQSDRGRSLPYIELHHIIPYRYTI